ncbi:MAG TPA: septal ring lytic transglycosylase RlpA family lipoprotein [Chitinophagaceae bacterium]|nr:septal ring lytic transglycosylase RlpA family lipoprotein [Chitinophagaceae bacterium]
MQGQSKDNASASQRTIYGLASYYANKFEGRLTANGEVFSQSKLTAACNVFPLGTKLKVTNLRNRKSVIVRTNDRLHPNTRRIIDLTYTAASKLGFIHAGLARVRIEVVTDK